MRGCSIRLSPDLGDGLTRLQAPPAIRVPYGQPAVLSDGISMSTALAPRMRNRKWYALVVGLLASIALCASTVTASASNGDRVLVQNNNSGYCMSVPGDNIYAGALINQFPCGNYPDQDWFMNQSDSHPGWIYLQPAQDDTLCATYVPGSTAEITLEPCGLNAGNGNANTQLWLYEYGDWGGELATTQGWAMSVPGASTGVAPINTYPWGNYPDQIWLMPSV